MPAFAYARSGSADVELAAQLASLRGAGCSDIAIDRTHGRHPRDLRRRAALLEALGPGDTVMVYRLDCLAVSGVDLIVTIAHIRSRNAVLLTTAPNGSNSFCYDTIDAITSAFDLLANAMPSDTIRHPRFCRLAANPEGLRGHERDRRGETAQGQPINTLQLYGTDAAVKGSCSAPTASLTAVGAHAG